MVKTIILKSIINTKEISYSDIYIHINHVLYKALKNCNIINLDFEINICAYWHIQKVQRNSPHINNVINLLYYYLITN